MSQIDGYDLAKKTGAIMRPLSKGLPMNQKLLKFAVKSVIGLAFTAVVGYTIKLEHKVEDKIDEHFDGN
jgi:hypothetical protein